jgi:hypothetical protein
VWGWKTEKKGPKRKDKKIHGAVEKKKNGKALH